MLNLFGTSQSLLAPECQVSLIKKLTANIPLVKDTILPTINGPGFALTTSNPPSITKTLRLAPNMVGIANKKLNSAALDALSLLCRPVNIVIPERDVPGINAIACATPTLIDVRQLTLSSIGSSLASGSAWPILNHYYTNHN